MPRHKFIVEALKEEHPNIEFTLSGDIDNGDDLENNMTVFTDETVDYDEIIVSANVKQSSDNNYVANRTNAYPDIGEQLDKLYHDIDNDKLNEDGEFFKALKAVKDDFPKP